MKNTKRNQGRNVINIKKIKEHLSTFSKEEKLSLAIDTWLQKTFVRWLINHFSEVQVVESVERYEEGFTSI